MPDEILLVLSGSQTGQQFPLTGETFTIGRDPVSAIHLDDGSISRQHACISRQGDTLLIEDLGSANGTWINGERITSPVPLTQGDQIQIGLEAGLRLETSASTEPTRQIATADVTQRIDPSTRPTEPIQKVVPVQQFLVVQRGSRAGQTIPLLPGRYTIGQDPASVIRFSDPGVSPNHAVIVMQPEGIWIQDLGSNQGTQVNAQTITTSTWLKCGDTLGLGKEVLFSLQEDPLKKTTFLSPAIPIPLSQMLQSAGAGAAPPQAVAGVPHGTPAPGSGTVPHAAGGASGPAGPQAGSGAVGGHSAPQAGAGGADAPASPPAPAAPGGPAGPGGPGGPPAPPPPAGPGPGGPSCLLTASISLGVIGVLIIGGFLILQFMGIQLPFLPQINPPAQATLVIIPDVVGMDQAHATATLQTVGLTVKIEEIPIFQKVQVEIGYVFAQIPPAGTTVEKGSTVILQIPVAAEDIPALPEASAQNLPTQTPTQTITPITTVSTATPTQTAAISQTPTQTATATITPTEIPCNRALWKADITVPDGTKMAPGQKFTKIWEVENTGTCTWDSGYRLIFDHGSFGQKLSPYQFITADVSPGQRIQISIGMTAPTTPGEHQSHWTMRSSSGEDFHFGKDRNATLYTTIEVVTPPTITPTIR